MIKLFVLDSCLACAISSASIWVETASLCSSMFHTVQSRRSCHTYPDVQPRMERGSSRRWKRKRDSLLVSSKEDFVYKILFQFVFCLLLLLLLSNFRILIIFKFKKLRKLVWICFLFILINTFFFYFPIKKFTKFNFELNKKIKKIKQLHSIFRCLQPKTLYEIIGVRILFFDKMIFH